MPELPDVTVYVEALAARAVGQPLEGVRLGSPFLLRTADPPLSEARLLSAGALLQARTSFHQARPPL